MSNYQSDSLKDKQKKYWKCIKSNNTTLGEKVSTGTVSTAINTKRKMGMGAQ